MIGFGIDEIQAEYVAEIKLRHLNREYILKRTKDLEDLEKEIAELDEILKSKARIKTIIVKELKSIAEKYGQPRKSIIIYDDVARYEEETVEIPDYPVNLFFTKEGYFKKITPQSLRMSGEQKLKDGDEIIQELEFTNNCDLCSLQTSVRCIRQRLMILHRQRQAYSVTMLPQSLVLTKAKMQ